MKMHAKCHKNGRVRSVNGKKSNPMDDSRKKVFFFHDYKIMSVTGAVTDLNSRGVNSLREIDSEVN